MKKLFFLLLSGILLLSLTACGGGSREQPPSDFDPVSDINLIIEEDVPAFIMSEIDRESEDQYAYQVEDVLYLVATMGEKPTSGYEITFVGYRENQDHTMDVFLETTEPAEDEAVLQVLTFPAAYARFYPDLPVFHVRFHIDGEMVNDLVVETMEAPPGV
ncbi:MAG: protease complex subunit PrcB family protein [Bacillota bacterium]|nr:protease complex subunit PrcB family protein [Bacillota bacterium]MDW7682895.1 protease complex subunit PrcB family protein [Bacillota bacterium]